MGFIFLLALLALYLLPVFVAWGKPQAWGVALLDILLGWTVVFWAICLIWAFTGEKRVKLPV